MTASPAAPPAMTVAPVRSLHLRRHLRRRHRRRRRHPYNCRPHLRLRRRFHRRPPDRRTIAPSSRAPRTSALTASPAAPSAMTVAPVRALNLRRHPHRRHRRRRRHPYHCRLLTTNRTAALTFASAATLTAAVFVALSSAAFSSAAIATAAIATATIASAALTPARASATVAPPSPPPPPALTSGTPASQFALSVDAGCRRERSLSEKTHDPFCVNGHQLPALFLIGAQKCGTTSLAKQLKEQYGVSTGLGFKDGAGFSNRKEPHFFNTDTRYERGLEHYASIFPPCGQDVLTMDATPDYLFGNVSLGRIARMYGPERLERTTFATLLCEPLQRAQSAFYHMRSIPVAGFDRPSSATFPDFVGETSQTALATWAHGRYGPQLDRILDELGQVAIIPTAWYLTSAQPTLIGVARPSGAPQWQARTSARAYVQREAFSCIRRVTPAFGGRAPQSSS